MALPHEDLPLYREAVTVTQNATSFAPRLIEKDYFCSLVLQHLYGEPSQLVFKGGLTPASRHMAITRFVPRPHFSMSPVRWNISAIIGLR